MQAEPYNCQLRFKDEIYDVRVGFNEAGRIAEIALDMPQTANRHERIAVQRLGQSLTEAVGAGSSLEDLAAVYNYGQGHYSVWGHPGVRQAKTHFDMVFQVLALARPRPALRLVAG